MIRKVAPWIAAAFALFYLLRAPEAAANTLGD